MPYCANCGSKIENEDRYCGVCGTPIADIGFEAEVVNNNSFSENYSISDANPTYILQRQNINKKSKKRKAIGLLIIAGIVGTICFAVFIALILFVKLPENIGYAGERESSTKHLFSETNNYLIYKKGSANYLFDINRNIHSKITDDISSGNSSDGVNSRITRDGKYIIYSEISDNGNGISVYCKEIAKIDSEAVEICNMKANMNTALGFLLSLDWYNSMIKSNVFLYFDNEENICLYDMDSGTRSVIGKNIAIRGISDDGKAVFYVSEGVRLNVYFIGKGSEEITNNFDEFLFCTADGKTVYFSRKINGGELSLVKKTLGENEIVVEPNFRRIEKQYKTGEFYYSSHVKPEDTSEDYLYYYDGNESKLICDRFANDNKYCCCFANDKPIVMFSAFSPDSDGTDKYIAVKGEVSIIEEARNAVGAIVNSSGNIVYYTDNIETDDGVRICNLNRITIDNGQVVNTEVYDSKVAYYDTSNTDFGIFINETDFAYYKNYSSATENEFYINKNKIDDNVWNNASNHLEPQYVFPYSSNDIYGYQTLGLCAYYRDGCYYYLSESDSESSTYTLKMFNGKNVITIAKEVYKFTVTSDGQVFYSKNYNDQSKVVELWIWNDGENKMVVDGIAACYVFSR